MKGNTFRTSHPKFPQAVVQDGGGQVLMIGRGGAPHMLLSSLKRCRELFGEIVPWRQKDDDEQKGRFWNGKQSFADEVMPTIKARSVATYGEDAAVWWDNEQREAARRRIVEHEQQEREAEAREAEAKELREKEEEIIVARARKIQERREAAERKAAPSSSTSTGAAG